MPSEAASSVKGAVKDAVSSAQDALPDGGDQAPAVLGEARGAAKEAATGAAEMVKDAAPSNPFAGFFGGEAMALQDLCSCALVQFACAQANAQVHRVP